MTNVTHCTVAALALLITAPAFASDQCGSIELGCAAPTVSGCCSPVAASCCGPVSHSCCGTAGCSDSMAAWCCDGAVCPTCCCCCYCGNRRYLQTTGDLYPHYAYRPENHGTYYFRPYGPLNIDRDRAAAAQIGNSPASPYATTVIDSFYAQGTVKPASHKEFKRRYSPNLPGLEALLQKK